MKENKRYKSNRSKEDIENSKTNYDKKFYDGHDESEEDELH